MRTCCRVARAAALKKVDSFCVCCVFVSFVLRLVRGLLTYGTWLVVISIGFPVVVVLTHTRPHNHTQWNKQMTVFTL